MDGEGGDEGEVLRGRDERGFEGGGGGAGGGEQEKEVEGLGVWVFRLGGLWSFGSTGAHIGLLRSRRCNVRGVRRGDLLRGGRGHGRTEVCWYRRRRRTACLQERPFEKALAGTCRAWPDTHQIEAPVN